MLRSLPGRCGPREAKPLVPPLSQRTSPSNFVDRGLFDYLLEHEVRAATRLRYYLSVLSLSPDLPSTDLSRALIERLAEAALRHLRATDIASVTTPSSLTFLLLDAEVRNLRPILLRMHEGMEPLFPRVSSVRRGNAPLLVSAGGGCYPQTASNARELLRQAEGLMTRAKEEGGGRLHLPEA